MGAAQSDDHWDNQLYDVSHPADTDTWPVAPYRPTKRSLGYRLQENAHNARPCDSSPLLKKLVIATHEYMTSLVFDVEEADQTDTHPAAEVCFSWQNQSRVLATFGQYTNPTPLYFDLNMHSIDEWFILYETVIRCTVEPYGRGFVFISWFITVEGEQCGHGTVLYLDKEKRIQMFVDHQ